MVLQSLTNWLHELVFFGGNVQTTALALAILASLCVSLVWLVVSLINNPGEHESLLSLLSTRKQQKKSRRQLSPNSPAHRRASLKIKRESYLRCGSRKSVWSSRSIEHENSVPCMRCGTRTSDFVCRYVLCESCCQTAPVGLCEQHGRDLKVTPAMASHQSNGRPTAIDLSHLRLYQCPEQVGYLGTQLISLNLSHNQLHMLPAELASLQGLKQLRLSHNCLRKLPWSLGQLYSLENLDVQHNMLLELPSSVCQLKHLLILQVAHNRLCDLPEHLGQLTRLQEISASHNSITTVPESIGNLTSLKRLYLGENPLSDLPLEVGHLRHLEELSLSMCLLRVLPRAVVRCKALRRLCVSFNSLTWLPEELGWLLHLLELNVSHNCLRYLPASLPALNLYTLIVQHNPLLMESDLEFRETVAPSVKPEEKLPPLLELAARAIYKLQVPWSDQELPAVLKEMLESVGHCSLCRGPLFQYYQAKLVFRVITGMAKVPMYERLCSPHQPRPCTALGQ